MGEKDNGLDLILSSFENDENYRIWKDLDYG